MITDAILGVLFAAARAVVGLIPDWTAPSFVDQISAKAEQAGDLAAGFGAWVPWGAAITVMTAVIATFATINGVRLLLWLWSKLPVIGR
jgi:hypothetical protein